MAKVFKYTKECTILNRQNKANCIWNEFENDKTAQEENMKQVLEDDEEDCIAVFKYGSSLGESRCHRCSSSDLSEWYKERHLFKWT